MITIEVKILEVYMKRFITLCVMSVILLSVLAGCDNELETNESLLEHKQESEFDDEQITIDVSESNQNDLSQSEKDNLVSLSSKYEGVPIEYELLLDAYIEIANLHRYGGYSGIDWENDYPNVSEECLSAIKESVEESASRFFISYATKDINNDGIEELFFIDCNYNIYSMLTIVRDEVVLITYRRYGITACAIDFDGNIYIRGGGKGESWYRDVFNLGLDGKLYGITYGHYDHSGFDDPDVYNYYDFYDLDNAYSLMNYSPLWNCRITDEELNALDLAVNEVRQKMDSDGCGSYNHITRDAGLKVHEVITTYPENMK